MADKAFTESGIGDFNKDLEANIKRLERLSKAADKASDSIDSLEASYNRLASLAEEPINFKIRRSTSTSSRGSSTGNKGGSTGNKGGKSKNDLFFTITRLSDTATSAIKPVSSLASNITKLGIATGGTIAALTLLAKITVEAQKNTSNYARSMTAMNKELSLLDKRSLETTNKINTLNNRMSNLMQGLGNLLSPVLDFIVDLAEVATSFLPSGERKDIVANTKANISSTAHQSGMTRGTGNALADNTYSIALGLTDKYGEQASVIADKLASAWQTGSEAAKDYGVVLNDNVLTGYLWNKGIDIANVEITDAMKQYYRYQLMVDQTSGKVTDSMIKDWTSLGFMIDKTKGKLFSFDEVIQLVAADPTIPDLVGSKSSWNETEGDRNNPTPPVVTPYGGVPPFNMPAVEPVTVPVEFNVTVPGLELVPELLRYIELIPAVNLVTFPVTVSGLELVPELLRYIESVPAVNPVTFPVTVPGLDRATLLLNYCNILTTTPWLSTVNLAIPSLYLAPMVLGYLVDIAKNWTANIDLKVTGLEVLAKAEALLSKVAAWLQALGQGVKVKAGNTVSTVKSGVGSVTSGIGSTAMSFGQGFVNSKSKNNSLLGSWAPTSAKAYGGGLSGAFKADLDLNSTRLGLKSATAEGYTTSELNKATAEYLGYNLNPLNKNSAAQLMAEGALASGAIASGIGAAKAAAPAIASAGSTVLNAIAGAGSTVLNGIGSVLNGIGSLTPALTPALAGMAFADGGIGTREINNATLFEGNKKEAVIPLESNEGIEYLANAMNKAGAGNNTSGDIVVNLTLSGLNLANNDAEWERVGRKIGEVIDIQKQRRGELDYGSSF